MPSKRTPLFLAATILVFVIVAVWLVYFPAKPSLNGPVPDDEDASQPIRPLPNERIKLPAKQLSTVAASPVSSANAADLYQQAFGFLAATDLTVVADWQADLEPAETAKICAQIKSICALAQQATTTTNCHWNENHAAPGPGGDSFRALPLAWALVWHAAHCRTADSAGVGEDLAEALFFGQAFAKPASAATHLVNLMIQNRVIYFLAQNATTLPNEVLGRLTQLLANDQSTTALASAWEADAAAFNGSADQIAALSAANAPAALQKLVGDNATKFSQAQAVTALRLVAELETEYAQALTAPDPEYQAWLDRTKAQRQANPLMDLLLPTSPEMDTVLDKTQTLAVSRALLLAGLAYVQGEPDALANHLDPSSGAAFIIHQSDAGFELQSAYQVNGAPLVMFFPKH